MSRKQAKRAAFYERRRNQRARRRMWNDYVREVGVAGLRKNLIVWGRQIGKQTLLKTLTGELCGRPRNDGADAFAYLVAAGLPDLRNRVP